MNQPVVWAYLINATLLIAHEIDSAYQREWEMLRLPGGPGGFLLIHLPVVGLVLYGLVLLVRGGPAGLWFSLALAGCGVLAFCLHLFFLRKGHPAFRQPVSLFILGAILAASLAQAVLTVGAM